MYVKGALRESTTSTKGGTSAARRSYRADVLHRVVRLHLSKAVAQTAAGSHGFGNGLPLRRAPDARRI